MGLLDSIGDAIGSVADTVENAVSDSVTGIVKFHEGMTKAALDLAQGDYNKAWDDAKQGGKDFVNYELKSADEGAPIAEAVFACIPPLAWVGVVIWAADTAYRTEEGKPGGIQDVHSLETGAVMVATAAGYGQYAKAAVAGYDAEQAYENGDTEGALVNGGIAVAGALGGENANTYIKDIKVGKALYDAADGRGNAVDALAVAGGAVAGQTGHGDIATGFQVGRAGYDIADGRGGVHEIATIGGAAAGAMGEEKVANAFKAGDAAYRKAEGHGGSGGAGAAGGAVKVAAATGHGDLATGIGVGYGLYQALESFNRSSATGSGTNLNAYNPNADYEPQTVPGWTPPYNPDELDQVLAQ